VKILGVGQAPLACKRSIWYPTHTSPAADKTARRTAMVSVTTMEELPILFDEERAEMLASLKAAEARIAAGQYVKHDRESFVKRMLDVRAAAMRNKKA